MCSGLLNVDILITGILEVALKEKDIFCSIFCEGLVVHLG